MQAPAEVLPQNSSKPTGVLWRALILLVLSVAINYIDRGNLSVAAPLLKTELAISNAQLGVILSSFFWTYALFQLVSGWLVDRYNANWVLAAGFVAWSVATAATGLIGGFTSLLMLRLLVGIGESVAYPAYSKIFAVYYAEGQRGMANSLIDVGCKLGPALGTLTGGLFMAKYGWRPFFFLLGMGALLWLPFWLRWMPRRRSPGRIQSAAQARVPRNPQPPGRLGNFRRALLLKLLLVFYSHLAALLPRAGAPFLAECHGGIWVAALRF